MKRLFRNEIAHFLNGGTVRGLSINSLMFFLDSLSGDYVGKKILILAEKTILSSFERRKFFFKNNIFYFPKTQKDNIVPGFQTQQNLHKSETLVGITEQGFGVCLTSEKTANDKTIKKAQEKLSHATGFGMPPNQCVDDH